MRRPSRERINMRIAGLKARLTKTNGTLADEYRRPLPDATILQKLKRMRVRLKDEIHGLSYG